LKKQADPSFGLLHSRHPEEGGTCLPAVPKIIIITFVPYHKHSLPNCLENITGSDWQQN
jgi:hypothetical protein